MRPLSTHSETSKFSADPDVQRRITLFARKAVRRMNLPRASAEDIAQTVLMKLSALPKERLEEITNVTAYLMRIVMNEAADFYRTLEHETADPPQPFEESHYLSVPDSMEAGILLKEIWTQLNDRDRSLLQLMILGYTDKEISLRLRISYASSRKRISRLREKINLLLRPTV